jgi:hypothetical protein
MEQDIKYKALKEVELLRLGNNVYRASYYSSYNEFGWGIFRKQALKYLDIKTRKLTVGLGFVESLDGQIYENQESVCLVFSKEIGFVESFPEIKIYEGFIENTKAIILVEFGTTMYSSKSGFVTHSVYISENNINEENISKLSEWKK